MTEPVPIPEEDHVAVAASTNGDSSLRLAYAFYSESHARANHVCSYSSPSGSSVMATCVTSDAEYTKKCGTDVYKWPDVQYMGLVLLNSGRILPNAHVDMYKDSKKIKNHNYIDNLYCIKKILPDLKY